MRGALVVALAAIACAALAAVTRNMRGVVSRGSWWSAFFGLWLISSMFSYLFIKMIVVAEWLWKRLRSSHPDKLPVPQPPQAAVAGDAPVENINHSRRYFFQAAGVIAGAVPFVSGAYGFVAERFRFYVREVEIPIAQSSARSRWTAHHAAERYPHRSSYMPVAQVRRAVGMANELEADLTVVTGDFLTAQSGPARGLHRGTFAAARAAGRLGLQREP